MTFAATDHATRPWLAPDQRLQRRTFRDYQPLFMMLMGLEWLDARIQRDFACIQGPVWRRYTDGSRRGRERRITALFLSDELNRFEALLYVGCDFVRQRRHQVITLWSHDDWPMDDAMSQRACIGLADRSVLLASALTAPASPLPTAVGHPRLPTPGGAMPTFSRAAGAISAD